MMSSEMDFSVDPGTIATVGLTVVVLLIVYYYFLVGALLEMIRADAPSVMVIFTYLSLIPVPPLLILGLINLIIWHCLREDLPPARPKPPAA